MPVQLGVSMQRHRVVSTSQSAVNESTIGNHSINIGAFRHAAAPGCPPKRHREGTTTSQFIADDGTIWSHAMCMGCSHHALPAVRLRSVIASARRRLNLLPRTVPLGVTQSVWEPAIMPLPLGASPNRHREGTTSQFAADYGTIWSHEMCMGC